MSPIFRYGKVHESNSSHCDLHHRQLLGNVDFVHFLSNYFNTLVQKYRSAPWPEGTGSAQLTKAVRREAMAVPWRKEDSQSLVLPPTSATVGKQTMQGQQASAFFPSMEEAQETSSVKQLTISSPSCSYLASRLPEINYKVLTCGKEHF